ncbi:hypothetical protein K466DRAFT_224111 [Polyporus arcularius HHB13444]|uniref:Uncharacterized protein n=1 Tax=Polyporus arcularius HHB13444 TaxID=1314778 RepID=A0A5C3P7F6_9APHY|nr:hypothetical protein K466DRAFT_224111 [Polyporus arcularius HHB13444]
MEPTKAPPVEKYGVVWCVRENVCGRGEREREEPLTSPRGYGEKRAARSGEDGRGSAGEKILAGPGSGRPSRLFLDCGARMMWRVVAEGVWPSYDDGTLRQDLRGPRRRSEGGGVHVGVRQRVNLREVATQLVPQSSPLAVLWFCMAVGGYVVWKTSSRRFPRRAQQGTCKDRDAPGTELPPRS